LAGALYPLLVFYLLAIRQTRVSWLALLLLFLGALHLLSLALNKTPGRSRVFFCPRCCLWAWAWPGCSAARPWF